MLRPFALPLAGFVLGFAPAFADAARLAGTVTTTPAVPVAATIVLDGLTGPVATTRAHADGTFELDAPAGSYVIRVVADGFVAAPRPVTLRDDAPERVEVSLRLAASTEHVVVSAGVVPLTRSGTGASVTVLDETELRTRQVESSVDALRSVPGLSLARSGGRGGVTSIFPRGGDANYTLVLVDGIRLNDMGGSFDAAHLPSFDLDRIEVVRGPQSALYGSDAVGGVIQLVSRRGGPTRAAALFEGGSFGTWRTHATASGAHGGLRWGGGVERLGSDGFTGTAPANGETVSNDDYRRTSGSVSLGYQSAKVDVSGLFRGGHNDRGVPGPFGSDPNGTFGGVDRVSRNEDHTIATGACVAWRPRTTLQIRGSGAVADRDSDFISLWTPDAPSFSGNRMTTGRAQVDGAHTAFSWSAGVEHQRERARSTYVTGMNDQPIPVDRAQTGAFVEGRVERGPVSLQSGVRVERVVRRALEGNPSPWSPRPAFDEDARTAVNPRLSASVRLFATERGWLRAHGNAASGMRAPDAFEIAFTNNPGLRPERTVSVDAGLEAGWLGGRLTVDTTWFHNRYSDLIVTVERILGTNGYRSDNISNARAQGLESSIAIRPFVGVRVRGGYTWLDTEILESDDETVPSPFAVGDALLRRPTHAAFVDVTATAGRVSGFLHIDGRGSMRDIDPTMGASSGVFRASGFARADAGVAVALKRVDVFARVTNLFDRQYEEILGYPALGRGVMAGVRIAAGH